MITITSAIILIGVIIINFSSDIYKNKQLENLRTVGNLFINCISENYSNTGNIKNAFPSEIYRELSGENKIIIYIYDEEGKYILSDNSNTYMPENIRNIIDKKPYLDVDSNTNISKEAPLLLYGTSFNVKYKDTPQQKIYILVYKSTSDISTFTMDIFLCYSFFAVVAILVSFLILRKKSKNYTACTEDMLRIIKQYSKGDFSEKLKTDTAGHFEETAKYINTLAMNVEKSEETSKTFIANVSHELRTPITTIGGFVDGILDGTIPKNRRNEYLILVSNEIQRLRILISSMLNMSRYESGTLTPHFRETNLTDLVIKTVFMFEKRIEDKNIEIEELDSERLVAVIDPDLIQQVIYNIIENAVKFVNEGGKISFKFEKEDNMCIIGIKNTGDGLRDEEIPQVFDRFYKTDSSRGKDITGLGLGLSISRRLIHINNGHIVVRSVYGEYTEFQIQVPEKQNTE
ncbi:MAG: HAMP domain-containing histidine kinase [Ruminococcus sp.]|nr:HAMP domain-containing histidine kinase [Ruminococcus sp.]